MAQMELPSYTRPLLPKATPPQRRCPSPRVLLCSLALASIILGSLLLTGGSALGMQHSRNAAAAAQYSSLANVRVATAIAAATVLPLQLPLHADLLQGGHNDGQEPELARAASAQAAGSTSDSLAAAAEAGQDAEAVAAEAAEISAEADRLLSGDGSVAFLSDDFDEYIAYDSAADAGMVEPEPSKDAKQQQQQQLHEPVSSNDSSITEQNVAEEQEAAEIWYGQDNSGDDPSSGGGSSGQLSPQDSAIAAILKGAALQGEEPVDMASCLHEDGLDRPFSVDDFLQAAPARLKVEAQFDSRLPRLPTAVTMLVTGTTERKEMLAGLCESYGSVISLAVYVGVLSGDAHAGASIAKTVAAVKSEFDRLEAAGACQLDILVVSERLQNQAAAHLFPINALRNLALLNAKTDLVMLGDLDLLAGADLAAAVSDAQQYQELLQLTDGSKLVVVPAFESDSKATARAAAAGGKAMATSLWKGDASFRYFLQDDYDSAHQDTRFDLWATAEHPYALNDTDPGFEPWWIGRRADVSVYDSKYRGYGKNKVQHLRMLQQLLGFKYVVHPRAYIVHRPHPASAAKTQFTAEIDSLEPAEAPDDSATAANFLVADNLNIFVATEEWFGAQWRADKAFRLQVTPGFEACRDQLQHWNVFGAGGEPVKTIVQPADMGRHESL